MINLTSLGSRLAAKSNGQKDVYDLRLQHLDAYTTKRLFDRFFKNWRKGNNTTDGPPSMINDEFSLNPQE